MKQQKPKTITSYDNATVRSGNVVNEVKYKYDANGKMTKCVKPDNWNAAFTLVYDAWNRLVQVKDGATVVATYFYDGINRRVLKVAASETRGFWYNRNWQCVEERFGTFEFIHIRYLWGLRYVDDLIFRERDNKAVLNGTINERMYAYADPNWNIVAMGSNPNERFTYSAFGKINCYTTSTGAYVAKPLPTYTHFTFTGQRLDFETGLMLYRNRVYHPTLGRFVQRDPIGYNAGDVSLYRYVGNQVIHVLDAWGLFGITCHCIGTWTGKRGKKDVTASHTWCRGRLAMNCCTDACGSHGMKCNGFDKEGTDSNLPGTLCSFLLNPCFAAATGCLCGAIGIADILAFAAPLPLQALLGALDCVCDILALITSWCAAGTSLSGWAASVSIVAEMAGCAWNVVSNFGIFKNISQLYSSIVDLVTWFVAEGSTWTEGDMLHSCKDVFCKCGVGGAINNFLESAGKNACETAPYSKPFLY